MCGHFSPRTWRGIANCWPTTFTAQPPPVKDFRVREVVVRLYGDAALVNTRATYLRPDGSPAQTRYVHVYARRGGRWQIVSVQITRLAAP